MRRLHLLPEHASPQPVAIIGAGGAGGAFAAAGGGGGVVVVGRHDGRVGAIIRHAVGRGLTRGRRDDGSARSGPFARRNDGAEG